MGARLLAAEGVNDLDYHVQTLSSLITVLGV